MAINTHKFNYSFDDEQLKKDFEKTVNMAQDTVLNLSNVKVISKPIAQAIVESKDALLYMRDVVEAKNWTYEKHLKDKNGNIIETKTITRDNSVLGMEILWDLDKGSQSKNPKLTGWASIMHRLKQYKKAHEDKEEIGTHYTAIYYADKYLGAETSASKAEKEKEERAKNAIRLPVRRH